MQLHHWITELLRSCVIRMLGKFADRCGLDESSVMLRFWVCLEKEVCCWASWQYSFEESCWASQQYRFRTLSESEVCHRSPCGSEWFWQLCHQTPCGSTPCGSEWQCQPQNLRKMIVAPLWLPVGLSLHLRTRVARFFELDIGLLII